MQSQFAQSTLSPSQRWDLVNQAAQRNDHAEVLRCTHPPARSTLQGVRIPSSCAPQTASSQASSPEEVSLREQGNLRASDGRFLALDAHPFLALS